jgi:hypothetical protein
LLPLSALIPRQHGNDGLVVADSHLFGTKCSRFHVFGTIFALSALVDTMLVQKIDFMIPRHETTSTADTRT